MSLRTVYWRIRNKIGLSRWSVFLGPDRVNAPRPFVHKGSLYLYFTVWDQPNDRWLVMRLAARRTLRQLRQDPRIFFSTDRITYAPYIINQGNGFRALVVHHDNPYGTKVGCYAYDSASLTGPFTYRFKLNFPVPQEYYGATSCHVLPDLSGRLRFHYTVTGEREKKNPRRILQAGTKNWVHWEDLGNPVCFENLVAGPSLFNYEGRGYMLCCWEKAWVDYNDYTVALLTETGNGSWEIVNKDFLEDYGHPFAFEWNGAMFFLADNNKDFHQIYFFRFSGPDRPPEPLGWYDVKKDRFFRTI